MNNKREFSKTAYFHKRITIIFIFLVTAMAGLMTCYWAFVLEPQLRSRAITTAKSVVKANTYKLPEILENITMQNARYKHIEIKNLLEQIMLLKDSESDITYITGLSMQIDHEIFNFKTPVLNTVIGTPVNSTSIISEIPLYANSNKELTGIITCVINNDYINTYLKRIKISFYIGAGIGLILLLSAWGLVAALILKVKEGEKIILEKQTQIIHAGRLTAMGEMATGIAHELNQPLAIIQLAANGLQNYFGNLNESLVMEKKASEKIVYQVDRAATIINNMRSFARTGNDKLETGDLRIPVLKAISFFREQFRINDIILEENIPENEIKLLFNSQRFEQVVVNLLTNARYALEEKQISSPSFKKQISVKLFKNNSNSKAVIEISDNGVGMLNTEKERCLEPFYTTKKTGEGTGLGLSIVYSILKENNMTIKIESTKNIGSKFSIFS